MIKCEHIEWPNLDWVPLSNILRQESKYSVNDIIGAVSGRYDVHKVVATIKNGYKVVLPTFVQHNGRLHEVLEIMDDNDHVTVKLGYKKEYRIESVMKIVKDFAEVDFFGAIDHSEYHNIEIGFSK